MEAMDQVWECHILHKPQFSADDIPVLVLVNGWVVNLPRKTNYL